MNAEEQRIKDFVFSSQDMFNKIIVAPEKYPILVFQPRLSPHILRKHRRVFHVYPIEHNGQALHGTVDGYYKKMPISAKQPKRLKAYKEKRNIPDVGNPFDEIIKGPDGNDYKLFQKTLPKAAIDNMAETFWVSQIEHEAEMRRGILCVYLKPVNLTDNPLEENEVRIIGAWEE